MTQFYLYYSEDAYLRRAAAERALVLVVVGRLAGLVVALGGSWLLNSLLLCKPVLMRRGWARSRARGVGPWQTLGIPRVLLLWLLSLGLRWLHEFTQVDRLHESLHWLQETRPWALTISWCSRLCVLWLTGLHWKCLRSGCRSHQRKPLKEVNKDANERQPFKRGFVSEKFSEFTYMSS